MTVTSDPICSVLILAGGRGQRMGGADKGLLLWRGKPLVSWVVDVARPLSDELIISCNRNSELYARYADLIINDKADDFQGPLAGIREGLRLARNSHLLVLPCDTPRLTQDLLQQLLKHAGTRPVVFARGDFIEPLFALLPSSAASHLEQAWQQGERSPLRWLRALDPLAITLAHDDARLANFNTPEHLLS